MSTENCSLPQLLTVNSVVQRFTEVLGKNNIITFGRPFWWRYRAKAIQKIIFPPSVGTVKLLLKLKKTLNRKSRERI